MIDREKVARALADRDGATWDAEHLGQTPNGESPEEMRDYYRDAADAAISAVLDQLRELVADEDDLIEAGAGAVMGCGPDDCPPSVAFAVWNAMLETAFLQPAESPTPTE